MSATGWRRHSLSLFFLVLFVATLLGHSVAGMRAVNETLAQQGQPALSWLSFVSSSHFVVEVAENWQSEFLQFMLYVLATVWLVQQGSPQSKKVGDEGLGTDREQLVGKFAPPGAPAWAKAGGWRLWVYSNSLVLAMTGVFALSLLCEAISGVRVYNFEQRLDGAPTLTFARYLASADFWDRTLQNWQSEFLAIGSMVAFSIVLRQRGSAESKPVGAPHGQTATEPE